MGFKPFTFYYMTLLKIFQCCSIHFMVFKIEYSAVVKFHTVLGCLAPWAN